MIPYKLRLLVIVPLLLTFACQSNKSTDILSITSGDLKLEVNDKLYTSLSESSVSYDSGRITDWRPTEYLQLADNDLTDFKQTGSASEKVNDSKMGNGTAFIIKGSSKDGIEKILRITEYDSFPGFLSTNVTYINHSDNELIVKKWVNHHYKLPKSEAKPFFWSFQGGSTSERMDWIKPLTPRFYQKNYMGMNDSDYGGGIPVTDLWNPAYGLAIGHTSLTPELISLPVECRIGENIVRIDIEKSLEYPFSIKKGDSLKTLDTFVALHHGDYYNGLRLYSDFMHAKGIYEMPSEPAAYEPIWCAWGYERNFTLPEIIGTLPKVKELGIRWAVLDDGYQQAEGDWQVSEKKFPNGAEGMKNLVRKIHEAGLKAKLWWAPLAADPDSKLLQQQPDLMLINSEGSPQFITWWDSYYLSPAYEKTIDYTTSVVEMFLKDWDFDGLKMDGQHMNAVPPDYNSEHNLRDPVESVRALPQFFHSIYITARSIKPEAVIENCPCGTCMSYYNMSYMNQAVASDPTSSWQIRLKGKTYKALIPKTAYYGDHVELSDEADDFASSFGIGAVLGTKFTWPADNPTASESFLLTPEKEKIWKKWFALYNKKMLSKAEYLGGLYDIGYDFPETHVIRKADTLHYAFYAKSWDGPVKFRGLEKGEYRIRDYFNDTDIGTLKGPVGQTDLKFNGFMLVEAVPVK